MEFALPDSSILWFYFSSTVAAPDIRWKQRATYWRTAGAWILELPEMPDHWYSKKLWLKVTCGTYAGYYGLLQITTDFSGRQGCLFSNKIFHLDSTNFYVIIQISVVTFSDILVN